MNDPETKQTTAQIPRPPRPEIPRMTDDLRKRHREMAASLLSQPGVNR